MRKLVYAAFFLVCLAVIWQSFRMQREWSRNPSIIEKKRALETEHMKLQMAKLETKKQNLQFEQTVYNVFLVTSLSVICSAILLIGVAYYGRLHVHILRLRDGVEVPIRDRDLKEALPIARDLTIAEKIEATAPEKAFLLYERLTDMRIREIQALVGRRGISQAGAMAITSNEQPALLPPVPPAQHVPTFQELLDAGEIAPGKPLILGYKQNTGHPEKGELSDLYSTIVIGLSGFGKTTFLGFVIASSVIAEQAHFDILDLHYPADESLGVTLGKLTETPYVRILSNPFELPDLLSELRSEMSKRLKTPKATHRPRILVVDEHERWSKHSADLVRYELDCVNEGRKVGMFLFLTSKSAKGDKIGDTALRDNCVTSYLFKTKPQNAHTFYHDGEKERLARQLKEPGQAVFTNRFDDSYLVRIPPTSPGDMLTVCDLVRQAQSQKVEPLTIRESQPPPRRSASSPDHTPELEALWETIEHPTNSLNRCANTVQTPNEQFELTPKKENALFETLHQLCNNRPSNQSKNQWQQAIAEQAGVSFSLIKNIMAGYSNISEETTQKLQAVVVL